MAKKGEKAKTTDLSTQSVLAEDDLRASSTESSKGEKAELINLEGVLYLRTLVPITLGSDTSSSGDTSPDPYSKALEQRLSSSYPSGEYGFDQEKVPDAPTRFRSVSDPEEYTKTLPPDEYYEDVYLDEEQEEGETERVMTSSPLVPLVRETTANYDYTSLPPSLSLPPLPFTIAKTSTGEGIILIEPPFDSDTDYNPAQGDEYTSSQDCIDSVLFGLSEEGG